MNINPLKKTNYEKERGENNINASMIKVWFFFLVFLYTWCTNTVLEIAGKICYRICQLESIFSLFKLNIKIIKLKPKKIASISLFCYSLPLSVRRYSFRHAELRHYTLLSLLYMYNYTCTYSHSHTLLPNT